MIKILNKKDLTFGKFIFYQKETAKNFNVNLNFSEIEVNYTPFKS